MISVLRFRKYALFCISMHEKPPAKKSRHVLAYLREALKLKQSEVASLIGTTSHAIQSIELGRLALSEKFAFRLAKQLGVKATWLLDNELGTPPPDPTELRQTYQQAQAGVVGSPSRLTARMFALRACVLACEVADQLEGFDWDRDSGFYEATMKFTRALNEALPDTSSRRKAFENAKAVTDDSADAVCAYIISRAKETRQELREDKAKDKEFAAKRPTAKPVAPEIARQSMKKPQSRVVETGQMTRE